MNILSLQLAEFGLYVHVCACNSIEVTVHSHQFKLRKAESDEPFRDTTLEWIWSMTWAC